MKYDQSKQDLNSGEFSPASSKASSAVLKTLQRLHRGVAQRRRAVDRAIAAFRQV